jgi:hypothetical protein
MTDSTQESSQVNQSSPRRGRWVLPGGIAAFLIIVGAIACYQRSVDPLPPADQIASMCVRLRQQTMAPRRLAEFEVPEHYYSRIRSALTPARTDRERPDCKGMGSLEIKTKTRMGGEMRVGLFSSDFAMEETYYHYPGGRYQEVEDAILAAHADASLEPP